MALKRVATIIICVVASVCTKHREVLDTNKYKGHTLVSFSKFLSDGSFLRNWGCPPNVSCFLSPAHNCFRAEVRGNASNTNKSFNEESKEAQSSNGMVAQEFVRTSVNSSPFSSRRSMAAGTLKVVFSEARCLAHVPELYLTSIPRNAFQHVWRHRRRQGLRRTSGYT